MALEQRLKAEAERTGLSLTRLRKRVAFEEAAIEDIAAAQRLRLNDFFTFMASRADAFDEVDEFLDPVLSGETHGNWDAAVSTWAVSDDAL